MGMKSKTIKLVLRKKINQWLASIQDEAVRELASQNTIVTGGSIVSMLMGDPVNDFDLYFRNKETAISVANYYVDKFEVKNKSGIPCNIYVDTDSERVKIVIQSSGIASEEGSGEPYQYFEMTGEADGYVSELMQDPGDIQDTYEQTEAEALEVSDNKYRPVFMSTNAITLSDKIQIVLRFYGKPEEIHQNYDFVHCTNYWTSWNDKLVLHPKALEAILAQELRYVGSKYPICSLIRLRKFIRRGWTINAGQVMKMAMQISELDLKDIAVLEDQLTGVDVAYFTELVSKLKERDPQKVNAAYLIEVIDRMF